MHCSRCGAALPADAPGGHCLKCILQSGLGELLPDDAVSPTCSNDPADDVPSPFGRFERYRLVEKLGEGGCGVVYRAEQRTPIRRDVALKVIKLGMDTRAVIARFEAERQALALMDHPNIAKVFDAGASDKGRPFFVMELVCGPRITDFCDQHHLSLRERLQLFVPVCRAVQHAHQKGVIHRDLKPSNVLVMEQDGAPVPKVIDFGVAKATGQQRLADQTLFTAFEQFVGTPAYMSPEQAGLGAQDIDTRSDVYSLGVLLYELLTGKPPFDAERIRHCAINEVLRLIRDEEPPRPSTRSTALAPDELLAVARVRNCEPRRLPGLLAGDLDWITMKALEKDRARRYETASSLALDLEHFLHDEPVAARAPGTAYRLGKLARRYRGAFAVAATILIVLLVGTATSLYLYSRESNARRLAQAAETTARTEADKSRQITAFLREMLRSVQPSMALGRDTTLMQEVVSNAAARVTELQGQPEVQAAVCATLGDGFYQLGLHSNALTLHEEGLRLRRSVFGSGHEATLESLLGMGGVLTQLDRWSEAETLSREALAIRQNLTNSNDVLDARIFGLLSYCAERQGRFDEAERRVREAIRFQARLGETNRELIRFRSVLAKLAGLQGRLDEAEPMARESVAVLREMFPDGSLELAEPMLILADIQAQRGQQSESEALRKEVSALRNRFYGPTHPLTAQGWQLRSRDPLVLCRIIEADFRTDQARQPLPSADTKQHVHLLLLMGMLEHNFGDSERAEASFRQALDLAQSVPAESWGYYLPQVHLGYYMETLGRCGDAENYFREAIVARQKGGRSSPAHLAHTFLPLAYNQICQGKFDEADRSIHQAWTIFETIPPGTVDGGGPALESARSLAFLSQKTTAPGKADEYLQLAVALAKRLSPANRAVLLQAGDDLNQVLAKALQQEEPSAVKGSAK